MNQPELDLFHAVVLDLKEGRHPGNRVKVPLLRQATIMKRNRTGFFNIKHAVCHHHHADTVSQPSLRFEAGFQPGQLLMSVCHRVIGLSVDADLL